MFESALISIAFFAIASVVVPVAFFMGLAPDEE